MSSTSNAATRGRAPSAMQVGAGRMPLS